VTIWIPNTILQVSQPDWNSPELMQNTTPTESLNIWTTTIHTTIHLTQFTQSMTTTHTITPDIYTAHIPVCTAHMFLAATDLTMPRDIITHTIAHCISAHYLTISTPNTDLTIHHTITETTCHTHIYITVHITQDTLQSEACTTMTPYTANMRTITTDHITTTTIQAHYGLHITHQDTTHICMIHCHQDSTEEDFMMMNTSHTANIWPTNMT